MGHERIRIGSRGFLASRIDASVGLWMLGHDLEEHGFTPAASVVDVWLHEWTRNDDVLEQLVASFGSEAITQSIDRCIALSPMEWSRDEYNQRVGSATGSEAMAAISLDDPRAFLWQCSKLVLGEWNDRPQDSPSQRWLDDARRRVAVRRRDERPPSRGAE